MEINSTNEEEDYKYYPLNDTLRYRQRITLTKKDEDNKALPKVKFLLTAKNVKELYSFKFNGWGDAESGDVDEDQSRFEIEALTDSNGKITYKFDYQIQSEELFYSTIFEHCNLHSRSPPYTDLILNTNIIMKKFEK